MDTKDKNPTAKITLPVGYAHIENDIQETAKQIREINEQIKNVPKDRGPELNLTPHGYAKSRPIMSYDQVVQSLEQKKTTLEADMYKMVERELEHADPNENRMVQDYIREAIYPNPYLTMDEAEKEGEKGKSKDIEQSQDFMDSRFKKWNKNQDEKDSPITPNEVKETVDNNQGRDIEQSQSRMNAMTEHFKKKNSLEKENINLPQEPLKEENKQTSISMRFSQSLSYTKAMENTDKNISPSKDKDSPDKD